MTSELRIVPGTRIALFTSTGRITTTQRIANVRRVIGFCRDNDIHDLIMDVSGQLSSDKALDMFKAGAAVTATVLGLRIAVVRRDDDDDTAFVENVAANRGAHIRSFSTVEQARDWLEPPNS